MEHNNHEANEGGPVAVAQQQEEDNNNNNNNNNNIEQQLGDLWDTLQSEFTNMGRALTCPLCLSTYKNAVVLPCVHAYCGSCIAEAFASGQSRCPTCLTKATRRSVANAPILNHLTKSYKLALRHFGLAPVQYDPSYNAMTQIAPGELPLACGAGADSAAGWTMEPYVAQAQSSSKRNNSERRKSTNLVESHTQLLVSRTWQKVLRERQAAEQREAMRVLEASLTKGRTRNNHTAPQQQQQQQQQPRNPALPANIPTSCRLHEWYQQQQASVSASFERALIDAAKQKRQKPSPSPVINLSLQHDLGLQDALEQQCADRQAEEEDVELAQAEAGVSWGPREEIMTNHAMSGEAAMDDGEEPQPGPQLSVTVGPEIRASFQDTSGDSTQQDQLQPPKNIDNEASSAPTQESRDAFFTPREAESNPQSVNDSQQLVPPVEECDTKQEEQPLSSSMPAAEYTEVAAVTTRDASRSDNDTAGFDNDEREDKDDNNSDDDTTVGEDMEADVTVEDVKDGETQQTRAGAHHPASNNNVVTMYHQPTLSVTTQGEDIIIDSAPTPRQSNTAPRNNTGPSENNHTTTTTSTTNQATASFQVGDIVSVQSRTWPGVNKPGGIARIAKILPDSSSYHVNYILGGREKHVDGLFISLPPEEMLEDDDHDTISRTAEDKSCRDASFSSTGARERKSRRIITQQQETKGKMEVELPPDLMRQLAAEGFDVTPRADSAAGTAGAFHNTSSTSGLTRPGGRVRIKIEGNSTARRCKSGSRCTVKSETAGVAKGAQSEGNGQPKKERPAPSKKKGSLLQTTSTAKQDKTDAQKRNAPTASRSTGTSKKAATETAPNKKRRKTASKTVAFVSEEEESLPPLPESNQELCVLAFTHYQHRIQAALDNNSVCIVASGLSDDDKAALKSLCKDSKKHGKGMFCFRFLLLHYSLYAP